MLSEAFVLKVSEIAHSKTNLLELMNQLDEEKRSIRSTMMAWSNDTKEQSGLKGAERYRKLRKKKDRMSFLIEEREFVRQKLGQLKEDQKSLRRAAHINIEFIHAFMAAAERTLSEEAYLALEAKAGEIMMQKI